MTWAGIAIGVGGAVIGGMASQDAARTQANAANRASGLQQQQYGQSRADLMPWMQSGQGALNLLNVGLGIPQNIGAMPTQSQFMMQGTGGGGGSFGMPRGSWTMGGEMPQIWTPGAGGASNSIPTGGYMAARRPDVAAYQAALARWRAARGAQGQDRQGMGFGELTRGFNLSDFQESPAYQFNLSQGLNAVNKAAAARGGYYNPATLQDISKFTQGTASNEFLNAYNMYGQNQANKYNRLFAQSAGGQNAAAGIGGFGANAARLSGGAMMDAGAAQAGGMMGLANAISGGAGSIYNNIRMNDIINSLQAQQKSGYAPPRSGSPFTNPY